MKCRLQVLQVLQVLLRENLEWTKQTFNKPKLYVGVTIKQLWGYQLISLGNAIASSATFEADYHAGAFFVHLLSESKNLHTE